MKFFVSSRMKELGAERKAAIEMTHFSGHTPLYIETEPIKKTIEAKRVMDRLIEDADALISIYYLSEGKKEKILNDLTPIEYEFATFSQRRPGAPILLMQQKHDRSVRPSKDMLDWFEDRSRKAGKGVVRRFVFEGREDLEAKLRKILKDFPQYQDAEMTQNRLIIRYVGPDFIGLVNKLSEVIFTRFRLNIDSISFASGGGRSTCYMSCSPRPSPDGSAIVQRKLETELKQAVTRDFEKAARDSRRIGGSGRKSEIRITVDQDHSTPPQYQFFAEIRTIDAPGQLNAICKVLTELRLNIDELQLRPTPAEYPRQSTVIMWLSNPSQSWKDRQDDLWQLERRLRYLIGVRTFSIQLLPYRTDDSMGFPGVTKSKARTQPAVQISRVAIPEVVGERIRAKRLRHSAQRVRTRSTLPSSIIQVARAGRQNRKDPPRSALH